MRCAASGQLAHEHHHHHHRSMVAEACPVAAGSAPDVEATVVLVVVVDP